MYFHYEYIRVTFLPSANEEFCPQGERWRGVHLHGQTASPPTRQIPPDEADSY